MNHHPHPLFMPEILERVFDHLDELELIVCCSVTPRWYHAVVRAFQRRSGPSKVLYKWPYGSVPRLASELCIVDFQDLDHVLSTCRGIYRLHLSSTEPATIRHGLVTSVFASCPSLKELCFSNLKFEEEPVKELLSTAFSVKLEIISLEKDCNPLDPPSLRLLLDNRELFSEVLFIDNRTKNATGWYPNPIDRVSYIKPLNIKRLALDCFGLSGCHFARSLVVLTLKNASSLSENSLLLIGRLPLKRFHISFSRASENCWIEALESGFVELNSLSAVNCDNLTESVLRGVAAKRLTDLDVDIRANASELDCVRVLGRMTSLKRLRLTCGVVTIDDITQLFSTKLEQLKSLTVIKYDFTASSTSVLPLRKSFIDYWHRKNVKIKYSLVHTITKCVGT